MKARMKGSEKMVSVFTATYNRAYVLNNLYQSLLEQTDHDFEWIIVDDGSQDGTQKLVSSWKRRTEAFPIIYQKVPNGGKHRAINQGVALARYEAFFIVDSDDFLTKDAIAFINKEFPPIADKAEYAGISGMKMQENGKMIGGFPAFCGFVDATNFERDKYFLLGDKAEVYKRSVLRRYPFPEFANETFLTEAVVWDAIAADGLKLRWFDKPIYYAEYMPDGLSRNSYRKKKESPLGWAEWIRRERGYGRLKGQKLADILYSFIETVKLSQETVCRLLEIAEEDYIFFAQRKMRLAEKIHREIEGHGIKRLALYGYGNNASRLMEYLNGIEIPYVIDRNYVNINEMPAYAPYMDLPEVDSVCITLKKPESEIKDMLEKKLPNSYIWQLADLEI